LFAVAGVGVSVWLFFKFGWKPALGMFAAVWTILMVVSIATTKPQAPRSTSDQPVRIVVADWRPEWEKAADVEARTTLGDPEDESYANDLVRLLRAGDRERIREIGTHLNEHGGMERMVRVCLRVKHLGGDASSLERRHWPGIGEWQG
jgi:hypothetical protein